MHSPNRCVIRLRTSTWVTRQGLHIKKDLTFLRRKSEGFNVLEEDAIAAGADDAIKSIVNLTKCKDGLYEVRTCNERTDWETGYVDDYELKLVPVNEE